jgi:hypothetical protein
MNHKFLYSILILFLTSSGFAAPLPDLAKYLEQEISLFDGAVSGCSQPSGNWGSIKNASSESKNNEEEGEILALTLLWVRLRPRIGFNLPGLVNVQVVPEIEMLWQRENPPDWVSYHP